MSLGFVVFQDPFELCLSDSPTVRPLLRVQIIKNKSLSGIFLSCLPVPKAVNQPIPP